MRWIVLVMLVGCGDNVPEVPTTVVAVDVACSGADCSQVFFESCGTYFPLVEMETTRLEATSDVEPPLAALVQLQYAGDVVVGTYGPDHPHVDHTLARTDRVDVGAALDYSLVLYRIDATGVAVDVDATHLEASDGQTLRFRYPQPDVASATTIVETHVIAAPRLVAVDATTPGPLDACCSVGRPGDLGIVVAALLMIVRRRRRTPR